MNKGQGGLVLLEDAGETEELMIKMHCTHVHNPQRTRTHTHKHSG